ncbi:MAG: hypothetical protein ACI4FZ_06640 [Lachnospiraceae bacterium]
MPLLSVYNHLMQGFVMMHQTRFDAHKKSELRDIYQNIMRLSSEQPLYKISFDESAQNYTLGIKNSALSLSSAIKELHINDGTSVFQSKTLVSDQPEAVSVSVPDGSDPSALTLPLEIEVKSLTSPQKNEGLFVPSSESELPAGQYNFTVGVEEKLYSFQFRVTEGSTNLELQTKLSDFINKTSIGLKTQVIREKDTDTSRLTLSATSSGTPVSGEPSFTLSDTRRPSDAAHGIIAHFGLDNISEPPQNTVFTVNGTSYETRGTEYLYRNSLSLSFLHSSEHPVTILSVTDKGPVIQKVEQFLDSYNSMLDFVRTSGNGNRRSLKLLAELTGIPRRYFGELSKVGIVLSQTGDGKLTLEPNAAYPAAENGALEQFFLSDDGFTSSLLKKLSEISINPMDYLDKTIVTYPNHNARKTYSPYTASIYSGLLYNNYC